jgi:Na+-translocating ferredoxin:NAD+ oxidoreductase RNF subunit RnfB
MNSIMGVIITTILLSLLGLIIGLFLGKASQKFKIKVDPKEVQVRALLPGANCGACGFAGCDAMAHAIVLKTAAVNGCPVGGAPVAQAIAEVMGVETQDSEKQVAFVKCAGTCDKTKVKYNYIGIEDCNKVSVTPGKGAKKCTYGCMGYGSCVKVCEFDAIHIVDGIAVVDKAKCVACGKCVAMCPNNIIELVPCKANHLVQCNSCDKGKTVKENCEVGCIACMMCTKVCEFDAIKVENNIAHIDYSKCTNCGKCAQKCPVKIIL